MDARDHKIEVSQYVVRIIKRAARKNIGPDPFQDTKFSAIALVEPVGLTVLAGDFSYRRAPWVRGGLRRIGNARRSEPALASSLRHHLPRFRTVGGSGVRVEDAAEILVTDEHGKLLFRRALDLAPALTQFRRDKLQAGRFVDRFLR